MDALHDTETEAAALPVDGLVARIERRYEQTRLFGRDIDDLFKQLVDDLRGHWPDEAQERLSLALRAFRIAASWAERAKGPQKPVLIASELALTHIAVALPLSAPSNEDVAALVDAWDESIVVDREAVETILLEGLDDAALASVESSLRRLSHQRKHEVAGLLETMQRDGPMARATSRQCVLFHGKVLAALDRFDDAFDQLETESPSAPAVILAWADVMERAGDFEGALERLKRGLIVVDEKERIRERMIGLYLSLEQVSGAVTQLVHLIAETEELLYWDLLCDLFDGDRATLDPILEQLREESPAMHADVLMAHGDHDGVLGASSAKTYSFERLWRIGHFLAAKDEKTAAKVFERAIQLQGATAQSKAECVDLGQRIENVIPLFERIGRTTKPRRIAREIIKRQKNNVPLKREMERLFGAKFG